MLYSLLQLTEEQDSTYLCMGMFMFVSLSTIKRLSVPSYVSQSVCLYILKALSNIWFVSLGYMLIIFVYFIPVESLAAESF